MKRNLRPPRRWHAASLAALALALVFVGLGPAQVPSPGPNGAGWHNEPFTVAFARDGMTCEPTQLDYSGPDDATPAPLTSTCTDPSGGLPPETLSYSFKYDATPPTVAIDPPNGSGPVHTAPFDVTLTWSAGVSGEAQGCLPSVTYSGVPLDVTCTDNAGNSTTERLQYPYDDTAPTISITSGPPDGSVSPDANPIFEFSSDDPNAQFWCGLDTLDETTFVSCASPRQLGPLAGTHTFSVQAVDQAGRPSAVATRRWHIGVLPQPTPPTISGFPGEAETLQAVVSPPSIGTPPVAQAIQWQSCDAGGGSCSDIADATAETYVVQAGDVDHTLRVEATATNEATLFLGSPVVVHSSAIGPVTPLDRNLPLTTIVGRPRNPTNRQRAVFAFESSRAGSTFECSLDKGVFQPCVSGRTYAGLAAGLHAFEVKATFQANNGEIFRELSPARWVWRIDLVPPPPPTNVVARGGDEKVFLYWVPPRVADVAGTRVARQRVGSLLPPVVRFLTGSRFTDTTVRNGVLYRYSLRTRDRAGNLSVGRAVYARPRDPLVSPRDGAIVTSNPLLDWLGHPHATYYNVQVHRVVANGPDVKVLTKWPVASRYQIPPRWFYLRWRTLRDGVYIWRVWPGLGDPADERYGRMIGSSVFTKR